MDPLGEVIRRRRTELGLSQADLARATGVHLRQIRRYEAGEQQPAFSVAVRVADALGLTVNDLAGRSAERLDLSGAWWAAWQTWNQGEEIVATQPVELDQVGPAISIRALERSRENKRGGYVWRGDLRLWDERVLMGSYAADDANVRSRGTFYFLLHPQGEVLEGRWVGLSYDAEIVTGWGAIAKTRDAARATIEHLKEAKTGEPVHDG